VSGRRQERLRASLHRAVQEVISRGLHDPRVSGMVTVTGVELPADLTRAVVSVSVYPEDREELTLHGLRAAAGHVRREVQKAVRMRRPPELVFKLDKSLKRQAEVLGALARAGAESKAADDGSGDGGADPRPAEGEGEDRS
jgi:ribosome-binding factor A